MTDSNTLFVLLEASAGYALFEAVAWEEIAPHAATNVVADLQRFSRAIKLTAFSPFENAAEALENANAISEHAVSSTLHNFLELQLPISKKASKTSNFSLGVVDSGLAADDAVREILRGCRMHLDHYLKTGQKNITTQAQLGLGHAYSRAKVKFNPARSDNMIIQSIALLDTLDKDVNTFAMRVREWYSWHFPELKDIVKDNIQFARCAAYIQNKSKLTPDKLDGLIEIVGDKDLAESVMAAAKMSMGMDCSAVDMMNICNFTQRMVKLAEYRKKLSVYLSDKMNIVAPNLSALIGDTVGARLISKAGSLTNLAKAPASTVQILGAEKALFRALKTKGNTPKYGLIYHSTFIGRADAKNKGRISRYLANKCSIATRIDSFSSGEPSSLYGERLREQVEERLRFYETGAAPRRNIDVMEQVSKELKVDEKVDDMDLDDAPSPKKRKQADSDDDDEQVAKKGKTEGDSAKKEKSAKKSKKKDKKKKKDKTKSAEN